MKALPVPVPGETIYKRYDYKYLREELGLIVNVRVHKNEDGSIHSWTAMVMGQDGVQPVGHLDHASDIHTWHPQSWVRKGFRAFPPEADPEPAAEPEVVAEPAPEPEPEGDVGRKIPAYSADDPKSQLVALAEDHELPIYGSRKDIVDRLDEYFGVATE